MMQPVWPRVTGPRMDDGHVLTLFKGTQECISALPERPEIHFDVTTDSHVHAQRTKQLARNSSEPTDCVSDTETGEQQLIRYIATNMKTTLTKSDFKIWGQSTSWRDS